MDIIELQAEGISNAIGYINNSKLTVAITTGKKLLNNESVSDDDMEIFNNIEKNIENKIDKNH